MFLGYKYLRKTITAENIKKKGAGGVYARKKKKETNLQPATD